MYPPERIMNEKPENTLVFSGFKCSGWRRGTFVIWAIFAKQSEGDQVRCGLFGSGRFEEYVESTECMDDLVAHLKIDILMIEDLHDSGHKLLTRCSIVRVEICHEPAKGSPVTNDILRMAFCQLFFYCCYELVKSSFALGQFFDVGSKDLLGFAWVATVNVPLAARAGDEPGCGRTSSIDVTARIRSAMYGQLVRLGQCFIGHASPLSLASRTHGHMF